MASHSRSGSCFFFFEHLTDVLMLSAVFLFPMGRVAAVSTGRAMPGPRGSAIRIPTARGAGWDPCGNFSDGLCSVAWMGAKWWRGEHTLLCADVKGKKLDIFFLGPKEFPADNRCRVNGKLQPGLNPKVFMQATSDGDLGHCPAKVETSGFGCIWPRSPRRTWLSARVMRQPPTCTALHAPLCTHTHTPQLYRHLSRNMVCDNVKSRSKVLRG